MRTARINRQKMYYAIWLDKVPVYERDRQGNIVYDKDGEPLTTGTYQSAYSEAFEFRGNIRGNGGRLDEQAYGAYGDYDALLYIAKDSLPIKEKTLIWYGSEPKLKRGELDQKSADYIVTRVPPSLNETVFLLEKVVK